MRAFQDSAYPGDDNLVTDGGHDPECRGIVAAFRGKPWTSVSTRMVRAHKDALPLFTPAAFRHYLPAYLLACIDAREEIDVAWDSVIFNLTPPARPKGRRQDFFRRRSEGFTELQGNAIREFLELVDETERASRARVGAPQSIEDEFGPAIAYWRNRRAPAR